MNSLLGLPIEASGHAAQVDLLIVIVHAIMFLVFAGWGLFFAVALVRFRKKRNPRADYRGVGGRASLIVEGILALAEAFLLVGLAIPVWSSRVNAFPSAHASTVVRVVAEQYVWNIHYPGPDGVFGREAADLVSPENPLGLDRSDPACKDDIVTINQLNIPVGVPVTISLTTKDVIHSFSIPIFRVKQDAIPGQSIPLWFVPTKTNDEVREMLTREYRIEGGPDVPANLVSMKEYRDSAGALIVSRGNALTDEAFSALRSSGLRTVLAAPDPPVEIACAQLCGLGHYRMRGFVTVQTPENYRKWIAEQESLLTQEQLP